MKRLGQIKNQTRGNKTKTVHIVASCHSGLAWSGLGMCVVCLVGSVTHIPLPAINVIIRSKRRRQKQIIIITEPNDYERFLALASIAVCETKASQSSIHILQYFSVFIFAIEMIVHNCIFLLGADTISIGDRICFANIKNKSSEILIEWLHCD